MRSIVRRVHPDLFAAHPQERAQNSESLKVCAPIDMHFIALAMPKGLRNLTVPPLCSHSTTMLIPALSARCSNQCQSHSGCERMTALSKLRRSSLAMALWGHSSMPLA